MAEEDVSQQQGLAVDPRYVIDALKTRIGALTNDIVMAEAFMNQQQAEIMSLREQVAMLMPPPDDIPTTGAPSELVDPQPV